MDMVGVVVIITPLRLQAVELNQAGTAEQLVVLDLELLVTLAGEVVALSEVLTEQLTLVVAQLELIAQMCRAYSRRSAMYQVIRPQVVGPRRLLIALLPQI